MKQTRWFERHFPQINDNGLLPDILERLSGTPARLEETVQLQDEKILQFKYDNRWSIKEECGHLGDLEYLWSARVDDLILNSPELRPADLSNEKTNLANHNQATLSNLLEFFRKQRFELVIKLRNLTDQQLLNASLHPRLKTPMRMVDLAYFVAEHDDHHLARIRELILLQSK